MTVTLLEDACLVARAIFANLTARYAPSVYFRRTDVTGRGLTEGETARDLADYYAGCFADYFARLDVASPEAFLAGKTVLEYGPGDFPGVALLMVAHGAERAICADRFPLVRLSKLNLQTLALLLERCTPAQAERMRACLVDGDRPAAGLRSSKLRYVVRPTGTAGLQGEVDFVFSRAVLEHVNDLEATFEDMAVGMRPGAISVHLVDLRSHGHHRRNPLDFLRWPPWLWRWMHSAKGAPNRWRIDVYRRIIERLPVRTLLIEPTHQAPAEAVREVRPQLASAFAGLSDDDLACLGFWVAFKRR